MKKVHMKSLKTIIMNERGKKEKKLLEEQKKLRKMLKSGKMYVQQIREGRGKRE